MGSLVPGNSAPGRLSDGYLSRFIMLQENLRPATLSGTHELPTRHPKVIALVQEISALCQPERIHWCDGSEEEYRALCAGMVANGTMIALNPAKRPGSYLCRSHPGDVARVEHRTFICGNSKEETGPTNNWADPVEMKETLRGLFK